MLLALASLRNLKRRLFETMAVVIVVFVGVAGLASIRLAASYSLDLAGKAWVYEVGSIVVSGDIPEDVVAGTSSLNGVERVKLLKSVITIGKLNGATVSIGVVYNPANSYPASYEVVRGGPKLLVYSTGGKSLASIGDTIYIPGVGNLTITGEARGVVPIMGDVDLVLLADKETVERIRGQHLDVLLVVAPSVQTEGLASKIVNIIRGREGRVDSVTIQTEEDNPAVRPMKSMASALEIFVLTAILVASLLIAGSEASLIERNVREIGVLKALGVGTFGALLYYAGYNILRGIIGVSLGLIASIPISKILVDVGVREAHGTSAIKILMERYPYRIDLGALAWAAGVSLCLVVLSSILPPLLAYRIPGGQALRFTGLTGGEGLFTLRGSPVVTYSLRRLQSRPWLALFIVLFLAVSWGATASIPMSLRGLDVIGEEIQQYGYDAKIPFFSNNTAVDMVVAITLSVKGVEAAEVWGLKWRAVELGGNELSVVSCIYGSWSLGPKLSLGRWPKRPGEAAITLTLSKILGVSIGDSIRVQVKGQGTAYNLSIVGIVADHNNNGMMIYVSPQDYYTIANTTYFAVHIKTRGDPGKIGLQVKNALTQQGIPAGPPQTKDKILAAHKDNKKFMYTFLTVINGATLFTGIIGLAVLIIVDIAGRLREIGVLRAIGFTDAQIIFSELIAIVLLAFLAAPLAYIIGFSISSIMLNTMKGAVGYVEPYPSIGDVAETAWILIPSLLSAYIAGFFYLKRQPTGSLLRVE